MLKTALCRIAEKWHTDKTPSIWHGYTPYYHKILKGKNVKKVLEIGIGNIEDMLHVKGYVIGASLFMWEEYCPEAEIFALDIRPDILINQGRIKSYLCDQSSAESLREAAAKLGGNFDLIVDDGSHVPAHQVLTAQILVPLLNSEGVYIIEDVGHPDEVLPYLPFKYEVRTFKPEHHDDRLIIIRGDQFV